MSTTKVSALAAKGTLGGSEEILINDGGTSKKATITAVRTGVTDATKLPLAGGTMTGNIVMSGSETVDGRDLSADGTKLDTVETNADVTDVTNVTAAGAAMLTGATFTGAVTAPDFIGPLNGAIRFTAKNDEGVAITQGQVVYIKGVSGDVPTVGLADANDNAKMPAFGLAYTAANNNASVEIVTFGSLGDTKTDYTGWTLGDTLYVSTTAGALTNSAPTGESSLIQNVGKIQRVHPTAGIIKVGGAGRSNATPNLNDGNVFIGNASNQAVSVALSTVALSPTGDGSQLTGIDALPSQSGNSGKYLTTDGSAASWAVLDTDANTTTKGLYEHAHTISADYSITSGNNAMTAGPITINSGVSVTVPTGSTWVIA